MVYFHILVPPVGQGHEGPHKNALKDVSECRVLERLHGGMAGCKAMTFFKPLGTSEAGQRR